MPGQVEHAGGGCGAGNGDERRGEARQQVRVLIEESARQDWVPLDRPGQEGPDQGAEPEGEREDEAEEREGPGAVLDGGDIRDGRRRHGHVTIEHARQGARHQRGRQRLGQAERDGRRRQRQLAKDEHDLAAVAVRHLAPDHVGRDLQQVVRGAQDAHVQPDVVLSHAKVAHHEGQHGVQHDGDDAVAKAQEQQHQDLTPREGRCRRRPRRRHRLHHRPRKVHPPPELWYEQRFVAPS
eukprot:scaffold2829_cov119-Isochrysis_galbana.AAC.5